MEEHLLNDKPYINYYDKESFFVKTMRYQKGEIDLPFWMTIRKNRMLDDTLERLSKRTDISLEALLAIQKQGYTLVRTGDPNKRKEITIILQPLNIHI